MSGGALPPVGPQPTAPQQAADSIPFATRTAFDSKVASFSTNLMLLAASLAMQKGASTVTDADINEANRQLTQKSKASKITRCLGAGGLVACGILLRAGTLDMILAGIAVGVFAIYIRKYLGND